MPLDYPVAPLSGCVEDYHGVAVPDPYRRLEEAEATETRAWVAAQNELTQRWLGEVAERGAIRRRLAALTDHPRRGAPWRRGERWFQLRNSGLQNQDVLWTMAAADDEGCVLLDPNVLSADGTVAVSGLAVTDDAALLAYATSDGGSDWMTWRVREVASGRDLGDEVRWSKFSPAAWAPDRSGFYYAAYDAPSPGGELAQVNLNQRLHFHRLGTDQRDDPVVYARPDEPEWGFVPQVTEDGRYLVIDIWHGTDPRNQVAVIDLVEHRPQVTPLVDQFLAAYAFAGNDGSVLLFRTDLDASRGRIVAVDLAQPADGEGRPGRRWREVLGESDDLLESARVIGGRLLGVFLHHAASRLAWFSLDGEVLGTVELPELGSVTATSGRQEDLELYFSFTSFTSPSSVYRHDLRDGSTTLLHRPALDFDADAYVTEQEFVGSGGVQVPVFLVHRRDAPRDGDRPLWLYGYGGFNIPVTPTCRNEWLVWLERGGMVAVANLRGGGEYGREWHDGGRGANKQRTFDDALAVARHLIASRWTRPQRLAIHGRSNGGLLAAACLVQQPQLFGAALVEVGVLDMLRFHTFTIGWGWTSDYGSADDPEQFRWLRAYSPLHRLTAGTAYPATLLTTGDHDDRVVPAHSYKFAAALQAAQAGDAPVLLRVETAAGHGAGKPTGKLLDERADVVAFLCRALQIPPPQEVVTHVSA